MRRLVVLGLLLASCSVDAAETTTTVAAPATTASPVSTTSTTEATTTTVPEVVVLGLRGRGSLGLRPDVTYFHDFIVPTRLRFDQEGWTVDLVGDRMVGFQNDAGDHSIAVYLTFMPFDSVEELLAFVQNHDKTIEVTDPVSVEVAGREAVSVDVLVPPGRVGSAPEECWSPVAGPSWYEQMTVDGIGYPSVLVGCAWNRVWLMEVDDVSVVIHAGDVGGDPDAEPMALEPVEPLIDEFLAAITFNP